MPKIPQISNSLLTVGDDVYCKPNGEVGSAAPWTETPWAGDHVTCTPRTGASRVYPVWLPDTGVMVYDIPYIVLRNTFSASITTNYGGDINSILSASILSTDLDTRIHFTGASLPSGIIAGKPYWVINIVDGVSFEIEATQGSGTPVDIGSDGSGTYTLASRRSASDFDEDNIVGVVELEDLVSGDGEITTIATILTELRKVPRKSAEMEGGDQFTRNAAVDTVTALTEYYT